ncbi:MAG: hypothetical protein ABI882_19660, partial [Acidobacteriota bacterium]
MFFIFSDTSFEILDGWAARRQITLFVFSVSSDIAQVAEPGKPPSEPVVVQINGMSLALRRSAAHALLP